MKVAIASGKGGTGKTMLTASLAVSWPRRVVAVDLDVEEPNLDLFLRPVFSGRREAVLEVPQVDEGACTFCRECAEFCQFKAISVLGSVVLVFPEMCHGCGGCIAVCPEGALHPGSRALGEISWGRAGTVEFLMGRLRVGEAMSPPLMRQVMGQLEGSLNAANPADVLIDAPPGVSCPAITAVIDSDVIVLVTEPTPFGAFDLKLAYEAFYPLGKPMSVVVNRAGLGNDEVHRFCRRVGLPILAEIPYERAIAEAYARGEIIAHSSPEMAALFAALAESIQRSAIRAAEACHA
jgi:MinD superfamily P-loop ATPase